jgi:hypothetical protein
MVFNTTFNNSSVISRQSVLLVEESGENNLSEFIDKLYHIMLITSGFGGGEFTKTLRKVCTCQKLKFAFLLLEYCKIRECYAVANAFTIRNMYSLLLYMNFKSVTISILQKTVNKTNKSPHAFAMCSIRTDLLKHENEKIDSL